MCSVKETARKITCPTESDLDEREAHREIPERCPERKVLDRNQKILSVCERVHRQRLDRVTPNVQEHKWWNHAVGYRDSFCLVKNTTVSEPEFCRSRIVPPFSPLLPTSSLPFPDSWNFCRDGDETSLERAAT